MSTFLGVMLLILNMIKSLIGFCLAPFKALFDFPVLPAEVNTVVNALFGYIKQGLGILYFFVPQSVVLVCLNAFLACWLVEHTYHLVKWVMAKIPFLGIK